MNKLLWIITLLLMMTYSQSMAESQVSLSIKKDVPQCSPLFSNNQEPLEQNQVTDCFKAVTAKRLPQLVSRLLQYKPIPSKQVLNKALEEIAQDPLNGEYSEIIKQLINAGASAENINLYYVKKHGHDIACESVLLILEANKNRYKEKSLLEIPITGESKLENLHYLSDTGNGRGMCPEAISLLASYNPKLLNIQDKRGFTPLHYYLEDSKHPQWKVEIAKQLMTAENINMQIHTGDTPLHMLINYNQTQWDSDLIEAALNLGMDITIKNNRGMMLQELIIKRSDLAPLINKILSQPH